MPHYFCQSVRTDGFIVSVEKLKNGNWVQQPNMSLPFPKSHFCTIFLKVS